MLFLPRLLLQSGLKYSIHAAGKNKNKKTVDEKTICLSPPFLLSNCMSLYSILALFILHFNKNMCNLLPMQNITNINILPWH
jgi:hypothetical protein